MPTGSLAAWAEYFAFGPVSQVMWPSKSKKTVFQSHLINTLNGTAGNSMTCSERRSPEPLLRKEASPALELWGWGFPVVPTRGIPRKALRAFLGVFPEFWRNVFRKFPAVLGAWPSITLKRIHVQSARRIVL